MFFVKQKAKTKAVILLLFCFCLSGAGSGGAAAAPSEPASLVFLPDYASFMNPAYLDIAIRLDPEENTVNLVYNTVSFDPEFLRAADISTGSSCPLLLEKIINNASGTLSYLCGSPEGAGAAGTTVNIEFKKIKSGFTRLSFSGAKLFLADGKGTEIDYTAEAHRIYVRR